jgi:hypothetical protein
MRKVLVRLLQKLVGVGAAHKYNYYSFVICYIFSHKLHKKVIYWRCWKT